MSQRQVIVIGAGPGGYVSAIRAAQLGAKVVLVEREKVGGTCLNRGCIPTKSILSDVKLIRSFKRSPIFRALSHEKFNPLEDIMKHKEQVVRDMVKGVDMLLESYGITLKYAYANSLGDKHVELVFKEGRKETLEGDSIILAPGSKAKSVPGISPDGERIITSDEALEMTKIPPTLLVVGGGYIGVEFATIFNALGAKVTIVELMENILPGLEEEVTRNLRRLLERDGINVFTRSGIEEIDDAGESLKVAVKTPQGIKTLLADKVLLAVGRVPNLDFEISTAGLGVCSEGIRVNSRMETSASGIYAIGDVVGGVMLAYVASEQGIVAAENAMGLDRQMEDQPVPLCVFTNPEVATIGLTEKEAREKEHIRIGRFPFRSNPKALLSGETEGLIKVIASQDTNQLLGVHVIGPDAGLLISVASAIMNQGGRIKDFSRLIQPHPTSLEALKEAFLDVDGLAIHVPRTHRESTG